jgi:hypothetical protein
VAENQHSRTQSADRRSSKTLLPRVPSDRIESRSRKSLLALAEMQAILQAAKIAPPYSGETLSSILSQSNPPANATFAGCAGKWLGIRQPAGSY